MVFEELSKEYLDKEYYEKNKYKTDEKSVDMHLIINTELANDFVKTIAVYRSFKFDRVKLTKTELANVIFTMFFKELEDNKQVIYSLIPYVNEIRRSE